MPPITLPQNRVNIGNGSTIHLPAGNYYISDLILKNGASMTLDATTGPVTLYITGQLEAKEGSSINMTGNPPDLRIYSNSSDPIILKNDGDFKGVVYAPLAPIEVKNSGDFYGICWGSSLELKNSGNIYVDVSAMRRYLTDQIILLSWKEIR